MTTDVESLARDMADNPGYYGVSVYRRNPCCYGDQAEVQIDLSLHHWDDAEEAVRKLQAVTRAIEILIDRFRQHGEIETMQGACEGCEVTADV